MTHDPRRECPTCVPLPTGTHFKMLGDNEWHIVSKLRTNISSEEIDANDDTKDYAPKDPYAAGLAKLRAAATRESTFEAEWKSARLRDVMATRAALDAEGQR